LYGRYNILRSTRLKNACLIIKITDMEKIKILRVLGIIITVGIYSSIKSTLGGTEVPSLYERPPVFLHTMQTIN